MTFDVSNVMAEDQDLAVLFTTILANDMSALRKVLSKSPALAMASLKVAATRENPQDFFLDEFMHYVYAGDTALHVAALSYRFDMLELLVISNAYIDAQNRRGAQPLHYACDGSPNCATWNPGAQHATISKLIELGADPNCLDKSGVAPIHRAVRTRCTGAVRGLISGGANVNLKNKSGSTPLDLAFLTTGKSGSGTDECKREQAVIVELLKSAAAKR